MSILSRMPVRMMRPSFPGEIDIFLGRLWHNEDSLSQPFSFEITLQYWNDHKKLRKISSARNGSGQWELSARGFQPALLSIQSWSLTGGLTNTYLNEQYPGLVEIVGADVAGELMRHMRGMLRGFVPALQSDDYTPDRRYLRFEELDQYATWMLGIWERFTANPNRPFNPERARQILFTRPWRSRKFGPPVHMEYLETHSSEVPADKAEVFNESVAAFRRLTDDALALVTV
jgi:hypothetical protein